MCSVVAIEHCLVADTDKVAFVLCAMNTDFQRQLSSVSLYLKCRYKLQIYNIGIPVQEGDECRRIL